MTSAESFEVSGEELAVGVKAVLDIPVDPAESASQDGRNHEIALEELRKTEPIEDVAFDESKKGLFGITKTGSNRHALLWKLLSKNPKKRTQRI